MVFNSYSFLLLAVVVFALYYVLPFRRQNLMLLAASYVFYGAWDWRFLGLILASTVVDYVAGLTIYRSDKPGIRKLVLAASCTFNLGVLGFFKYFDFFTESLQGLLQAFGLDIGLMRLNVILPVGISFYTFQTMSYTIDIYRRQLKPTRNVLDFALFVAYFPQLVAGPIERATRLLPQIANPRRINKTFLAQGAWLITLGLFKKCVIADNLSMAVDMAFESPDPGSGLTCLLSVYAFAIQIFCDFSGYSDIARGLAKLMGIELMVNFDRPYLACNPQEFWRRWHISLSTWLRDYLYIPLGGNRGSKARTYINLFVTMLLGGIWHGAAWRFVIWGAYHGVLLMAHRLIGRPRPADYRPPIIFTWLSRIAMFHATCLGWLIFRANNVEQIGYFLRQIFSSMQPDGLSAMLLSRLLLFTVPLCAVELWTANRDSPRRNFGWRYGLGPVVCTGMWLAIVILSPISPEAFIYFQF